MELHWVILRKLKSHRYLHFRSLCNPTLSKIQFLFFLSVRCYQWYSFFCELNWRIYGIPLKTVSNYGEPLITSLITTSLGTKFKSLCLFAKFYTKQESINTGKLNSFSLINCVLISTEWICFRIFNTICNSFHLGVT